jgi:hypothetical protein
MDGLPKDRANQPKVDGSNLRTNSNRQSLGLDPSSSVQPRISTVSGKIISGTMETDRTDSA